ALSPALATAWTKWDRAVFLRMLSSQANPQRRQLAQSIQGVQPQSRCLRPALRPVARSSSEQRVAAYGRRPTLLQLLRPGLHPVTESPRMRSGQSPSTRMTQAAIPCTWEPASQTAPATRRLA